MELRGQHPPDHPDRGRAVREGNAIMRQLFVVVVITLGLTAASCAFSGRIADDAVAYNISVEESHNRILFLNIIRSMKRRPRIFTEFGLIRGNLRASFEPGAAEIPVGPDATGVYKLNPKATYASNPSFDVAVLGSEKFMRGILTPVSMDVIHGYWIQGWPGELIFFLFVRRLDLIENGVTKTYENEPNDAVKFKAFSQKVAELMERNLRTEVVSLDPTPFGPPVTIKDATQLQALVEASKAGLLVTKTPDSTFQLAKPRTQTQFSFTVGGREMSINNFSQYKPDAEAGATSVGANKDTSKRIGGSVYTRSAEGIIYYLGELMRRSVETPYPPMITLGPKEMPLFVGRKGSPKPGAAEVSVAYDGEVYFIPTDPAEAGASMRCMVLAAQVFGLHRSSEEIPKTPAATIVGGR